jgi:hypothetical protein
MFRITSNGSVSAALLDFYLEQCKNPPQHTLQQSMIWEIGRRGLAAVPKENNAYQISFEPLRHARLFVCRRSNPGV